MAACGCAERDSVALAAEDYAERVASAMDVDLPTPERSRPPPWPRPRELRVELPTVRINLIEFLSLHQCDLGALVGFRNSGLGRVMEPSERFLYENSVTRALKQCAAEMDDPEVASWAAQKQQHLPLAYQSAVLGAEELARGFGRDAAALTARDLAEGSVTGLVAALFELAVLRRRLDESVLNEEEERRFRAALRHWAHSGGHAGARLALAGQLADVLQQVTVVLETRPSPLCFEPSPTPRARTLERIFYRFYADRLQPDLVAVTRDLQNLGAALRELGDAFPGPTGAPFRSWVEALVESRVAPLQVLQSRIREHSQSWNRTFAQCGILPGSPQSIRGRPQG